MSQPQSRSEVYYIALTGIFIGLTLLVKVVFDYFPGINVLANGYPIDFYLVFYVYGMILINRRKWQWFFAIVTPFLLLISKPDIINFWQLLMEYVLAMYVFLEFIYFDLILVFLNKHIKHKYAGRVVQILVFAFLFLISMSLKLFLHFLAGVIWWIPNNWWGSLIFNAEVIGMNVIVVGPISIMLYPLVINLPSR